MKRDDDGDDDENEDYGEDETNKKTMEMLKGMRIGTWMVTIG